MKDQAMIQTVFEPATGISVITWDAPDSPVNIKNRAAIAAFVAAVAEAIENASVKGVIITSAKKDFISGGDLDELRRVQSPAEAAALVRDLGQCLCRMEPSGKPFVAALNGSAMGGGLEVALACHRRIAVDDPALRLAFPEVTLGLIPGAGGTQRLPRLIGIARSMPLLMEGRPVNVQEALKIGLIDDVVDRTALMDAARHWIASAPEAIQPWDRKHYALPDFHPQSPEGRDFFSAAWPALRRKTLVADAAPGAILQVLHHGLERGGLAQAGLEMLVSLIRTTTDITGLSGCEAVFEAVVEVESVKHDVIRRAAAVVSADALIATNTSTLPISNLAAASSSPGNVIGMHFFAPVDRMPLLEVISGPQTTDATLARALDVAKLMGKTPIIVRDGRGFFTSRVVASYTREALLLLSEGVPPQVVDNAALAAGMPIGPLAIADPTSLDLLYDILGSVAGPDRQLDHHARSLEVLHRLSGRLGRSGRKASAGTYAHGPPGRPAAGCGPSPQNPRENATPDQPRG